MTAIPKNAELKGLQVLKQYGYTSAEEVFYLAQALGPELSELVGVAPLEIQNKLAPTLALLPQAKVDELASLELSMGVPLDKAPPAPLPYVTPPVETTNVANVNLIPEMPAVRHHRIEEHASLMRLSPWSNIGSTDWALSMSCPNSSSIGIASRSMASRTRRELGSRSHFH